MSIGKYKEILKSFGFQSFLWTQFLGALNDNLYKIIVSMFAINTANLGGGSGYLSLVGGVFILPFLLFSGYAGHLADAFNKRTVLILTKSVEIIAMGLAPFAFLSGRMDLMLGVLFFMAVHSTFFSPAKYGILPEILPDKDLSRANGLLEMSTFMAIILGTSIGGLLFETLKNQPKRIGLILLLVAVAGTLISLGISKAPSPGRKKFFRVNPWGEIFKGIQRLYREKSLWLTVVGISYFWFLGALFQMDLLLFGKEAMHLSDVRTGSLLTFLAIGIGAGSLLAGRLSGDKVELGLVPLGSIGIGICSVWLSFSAGAYLKAALSLVFLGLSAGLFIVPLNALLQQKSGQMERGQLIATNNFLNTIGILFASGALWLFRDFLQVPAERIILVFGLFTFAGTIYILTILPEFLIRFSLWLLTHTVYKIRIEGGENVPFRGPALLVCNHLSHVDGLIVAACVQRFIRFLIYKPYFEIKGIHWLLERMKAIPVSGGNRREVVQSLEKAREELHNGHVVCIFAEGAISRTGNLLPFKRGFEKIIEGLDVPVIPVHLDSLWGSIFSFKNGKFFWKWPQRLPFPVTVTFGKPLPPTANAQEVRQVIQELGSDALLLRQSTRNLLHLRFLKTAKRRWFSFCMADSTGKELSYGETLVASLLLARWIRKNCRDEKMVGLLLPSSLGGAIANIASFFAGTIPVNLNFTSGKEAVNLAIEQCGIKTIVTSKLFLAKAKLDTIERMVYLEEILKEISPGQKIVTLMTTFLAPFWLLYRMYQKKEQSPDSIATVIFSSGSTGNPKGVMLSHRNILSNIEGLDQIFWVTERDKIIGILPFFHSFGFTGTLWFPILSGFGAVYHPNPMDAKTIGELTARHKATILISTPTFCASYLRKCTPEEFSSLRFAIVGAEKLREPLAKAFKEKFGLDLMEGYGCTEMAPVVSVNTPDVHHGTEYQTGFQAGTVGHPLPGVSVRIIDQETAVPLSYGQQGIIWVKGPNRMLGYLEQPEKTGQVIQNGWYVTGDIGFLDDKGFLHITDRLSRFSKIGGEMVPHTKVEEVVNLLMDDQPSAVTSVPDEQKGERLVVFYTRQEITPDQIWRFLCQSELPKLWIPKQEHFYYIETLPTLGTGKIDLKQLKTLALERINK